VTHLEAALDASDDRLAYEAARALARTSGEEAAAALRRGAASDLSGTVNASLRGIELRKDTTLCDAAKPHLGAEEPTGSYARRAWDAVGCDSE
ncbi:MAG: hypothetical protein JRI25_20990, partial [Deltaproteobacteria bacterium]|nr:hypothetical protein [Deltaproteobacteria bacterium]